MLTNYQTGKPARMHNSAFPLPPLAQASNSRQSLSNSLRIIPIAQHLVVPFPLFIRLLGLQKISTCESLLVSK